MCVRTHFLLNSIIHFTFVVEKQDTYQYMDKEFSNIRIVDIAKMAGVSVGTVDRVIHNRGRVSEENRKKVQTILEMVHYQPNLMARSLASKNNIILWQLLLLLRTENIGKLFLRVSIRRLQRWNLII